MAKAAKETGRRLRRLGLLCAVLVLALVFMLIRRGVDMETLKQWWGLARDYLGAHPWWLFGALVILPGFPVPVSALLILTGVVWQDHPVIACGTTLLALALNMVWTYWVAARWGGHWMTGWLESRFPNLTALVDANPWKVLLVARITPGVPLFVQNYMLGALRIPFFKYLAGSIACNSIFSLGFVLSGSGVASGSVKPALIGIALVAVGITLARLWHVRAKQSRRKSG